MLPLQPIAAHSYIAILIKGNNSSKILLFQPIAARSCLATLITGGGGGVIPQISQKSSHCSPMQTTLTLQFIVREGYSLKVLPLQPIAAHSYMANLVREGDNSSKFLPLQPIAAHSYMRI